jgi:hypothetical protein
MGVNDHRGVLTDKCSRYILKHDDTDTASDNRLLHNPAASSATNSCAWAPVDLELRAGTTVCIAEAISLGVLRRTNRYTKHAQAEIW